MKDASQPTSLGPSLRREHDVWTLGFDAQPVLHGLSVLSRAIAEMATSAARSDRSDLSVDRRLRARENPELVERFGIDGMRLVAEMATFDWIAEQPEMLETRLRALLGSLQRQRYREALLPDDRARTKALVADFDGEHASRFVLEYLPPRRGGAHGSLRVTVENVQGRRIDLASLPHVRIDDVAERHFIAGSTRIAQTWTEGLRREAERGRRSFVEKRVPHSHLFHQLDQAGLGTLQQVSLQWGDQALPLLLESDPQAIADMLKRVLLAFEDRGIRRLLGEREVLRVDTGLLPVFVDIAQLGRVLELSLGQRRQRLDADAFLRRMPALSAVVAQHREAEPLRDVAVFLVHHMTAEVVGTIAALRALGCRDLSVLFVTYSGEPASSYLDAVLDLPVDAFRSLALVNVPTPGHLDGHYRLSTQYSRLDEAPAIERALAARGIAFLPAMRAAAVVPFLRQLGRCRANGRRLLLVEDGGYLGPVVQDALLRGVTLGTFAQELGADADALGGLDVGALLAAVLGDHLCGTVEHTRNGFDRLAAVEKLHGRLALPSFSIAISHHKRAIEAREVAASILGAVESVLNADGKILSRRRALVLGSRGAIGSELVRHLRTRLDTRPILGVDLVADPATTPTDVVEARTLAGLPAGAFLDVDLVLGVTGDSVLRGSDLEQWLLHGKQPFLVLASGSTKKVEFHGLMEWFDALVRTETPRLGTVPVGIRAEELLDPRTLRLYGHRCHFDFGDGRPSKTVLALGNLTPINFLFYGVATELIDEVLTQLVRTSLGLLARTGRGENVPKRLLAVDRDIDVDGAPRG